MEENVALDSTKQKKFDKSIKNIKKLIKKKDADGKAKGAEGDKIKTGRVSKKKRKERGLVYLSHIPHGFYENEMSQYFKQFGVVTNARVIKSKRTGRSKGYAFVEFKEPAVAQIVADTMNNYLMGKRLIKAAYVPPEKQKRKVFRKNWNSVNNPGNNLRIKMKKAHNENKDEKGELQRARKLFSNINKTKKKLSELGINYDFFTPVDIPEALVKQGQIKAENEVTPANSKSKKKRNISEEVPVEVKKVKSKESKGKAESSKISVKEEHNQNSKVKTEKNKNFKQVEANKTTQKQKKQNLTQKGVTLLEDYIEVGKDSDNESDSSLDFDSDEFDKLLENDDDSDIPEDDSDEESDDDDLADSGNDESEQLPQQKGKIKPTPKAIPVMQLKKIAEKKGAKKNVKLQSQQAKEPLPAIVASKKPKFEKQTSQKPRNKQFKKKK